VTYIGIPLACFCETEPYLSFSGIDNRQNNMLSLYIHIPFCVRKCPYCGFYSTGYSQQHADDYVVSLHKQASGCQTAYKGRRFNTVYLGGGTPTVLSSEQSFGIMNVIKDHFTIADDAEFTIEANPNSAAKKNLSEWRDLGVNRLSLGIQSFSDQVLHRLGRMHTAQQAVDAFRLARSVEFHNIGIDLMYGVPGQSREEWEETVAAAIDLGPEHISIYSLSLDEGSVFRHEADSGRLRLPDDDVTAEMYEYAVATLRDSAYSRYELSNFSLPGFECRHNLNYWERGEYLGLGPSASSFVAGRRFRTIPDHTEYALRLARGQSVVEGWEVLTPEQSAHERLLLGLRTARGVDLGRFRHECGDSSYDRLQATLGPLRDAGLLVVCDGYVRLTDRGVLLCNEALARLSV
jgi:oxygen-independent coproporphyrinogen-3 oxidase